MGTCADMYIHPVWAILIGIFAGFLSTFGYVKMNLEKKFHMHDSCGIFNLHGMPGFFGGIFGVIAVTQANRFNPS
jgi:ammonium transporter Rh